MPRFRRGVFIEGEVFTYQKKGGINRLFEELARRLLERGVAVSVQVPPGTELPFRPTKRYDYPGWLPRPNQSPRSWYRLAHLNFHRSGAAVYMPTNYGPVPGWRGLALVMLYDMIAERRSEPGSGDADYWQWQVPGKRDCLLSCDHIIAISHHSRKDLLSIYPQVAPDKVSVLHLGVGPEFSPGDTRAYEPYLLFVGNRERYKNFRELLRAYMGSEKLRSAFRLRVVTSSDWTEIERALVRLARGRVDLYQSVSERELVEHYRRAAVFVFPTTFEGFGLPVLEAMACGAPVVTSSRTSLPEVGGDAARYFDPDKPGDLRRVLEEVCFDPPQRERMRRDGLERARQFTWESFASGVMDVIEKKLGA
jgi:glycosyltransferase involved in cell wall biosynthesis